MKAIRSQAERVRHIGRGAPSGRMALSLVLLLVAGCSSTPSPSPSPSLLPSAHAATPASSAVPSSEPLSSSTAPAGFGEVTLLTHDSFALSDAVIQAFQQDSGYTLKILRAGDAGAMVNQAILSKAHPLGDVLFGVDNTFLSRALDQGVFEPYQSSGLAGVSAEFQLGPEHRVTPIDYGDVCLNLDKGAFAASKAPPARLEDLIRPDYKSELVVENPATSSTGLAFMLATIARFGQTAGAGWLGYWAGLRANDVLVSASWNDAYQTQFSAGPGKGPRPIVVSYASSPPAEVYFADPPTTTAPTSVVLDACFRQVEYAGVLTGAANRAGARAFIDFLLSPAAQADVPLQMFVFPVVTNTPLPDVFRQFAEVPSQPLSVEPAQIEQNRDRWIDEWTRTVLR